MEALCDPAVGALLDRLEQEPELVGKTRMSQIKILKRDRAALVDVPAEEQAEFSRLTVEANDVWRRAKPANDWESFAPYLDRIVAALKSMAAKKDAEKDPYDVWLNEYEWGTDRAFYDRFFSQVKDCVGPAPGGLQWPAATSPGTPASTATLTRSASGSSPATS